jgi:ApeA N-terminal domain 1
MKSFESVGVWFLPNDPETHVAGTISFSKEDGIKLALSGSFRKEWNLGGANYPLVHGVVSESPYGKFISLFGCFATNLRIGMPGISVETIHANQGYAGSEFVDSDAMLFDGASIYFSTLGAWLNYSGLKVDHNPTGVVISWQQPRQLVCKVARASISTAFELDTKGGPLGSISLDETPAFMVEEFGGLTANEVHSRFAGPLVTLMAFASDGRSVLDRYQLYKTKDNDVQQSHFDRLYAPVGKPAASNPKRGCDLLFTVGDVADRFEPFMQRWFDFVSTHADFCSVFFSYGYEKHGFLEARFLFLMQAALCLLQDETPGGSDAIEPFETSRRSLLATGGLSNQPYANLAFPSAIQMAMPMLFAKLLSDHWGLIRSVVGTTEERFVRVLFSTFDYVLHRGTSAAEAARGTDILWLHQRLAAVLKICVLKQLEFSDEKIAEIVAGNAEMSHLKTLNHPWDALDQSR